MLFLGLLLRLDLLLEGSPFGSWISSNTPSSFVTITVHVADADINSSCGFPCCCCSSFMVAAEASGSTFSPSLSVSTRTTLRGLPLFRGGWGCCCWWCSVSPPLDEASAIATESSFVLCRFFFPINTSLSNNNNYPHPNYSVFNNIWQFPRSCFS